MAVTDSVADMITIIRNGSSARKETVEVKGSGLTGEVLGIFKKEQFISNGFLIQRNISHL